LNSVIALSKSESLTVWAGFAHVWRHKLVKTTKGRAKLARSKKRLGQIIKRRIRFHEPALKALTICIVFVFTGIFLRFSTPLSIPNLRDFRSANGKL